MTEQDPETVRRVRENIAEAEAHMAGGKPMTTLDDALGRRLTMNVALDVAGAREALLAEVPQPVVHYVRDSSGGPDYPRYCRNAIVTGGDPSLSQGLSMTVFDPEGFRSKHAIAHSTTPDNTGWLPGGTWHRLAECNAGLIG